MISWTPAAAWGDQEQWICCGERVRGTAQISGIGEDDRKRLHETLLAGGKDGGDVCVQRSSIRQ